MSLMECINVMQMKEKHMNQREGTINWHQYFMGLAVLASKRSKDPNTGVGACIVDPKDNRVISVGYNGFPIGCNDWDFPWTKDSENYDETKYAYVVHAELNAILSARRDLRGMVLYVTFSPCNECMKAIIQAGIKKVVYMNEYKADSATTIASRKMARAADVELIKYHNFGREVNLGEL